MLDQEDFLLEESRDAKEKKKLKAGLEAAKIATMGFLGKAMGLYKRAAAGDSSPTLAGRATAYLMAFTEMAAALGIDRSRYEGVVTKLQEKIGALLVKVSDEAGKTIIEHRRDPKGVEVELLQARLKERELGIRELKVVDDRKDSDTAKVSGSPADVEPGVREVAIWLSNSTLGYDKAEAERRARAVYQPGIPIADLVASACRL